MIGKNVMINLLLMALVLAFLGCSKNQQTVATDLRINKIQHNASWDTHTKFYGWSDDKYLNRIVIDNRSTMIFKYKNDLIVKVLHYEDNYLDGETPITTDSLMYEDDVLVQIKRKSKIVLVNNIIDWNTDFHFEYNSQMQVIKRTEIRESYTVGWFENYIWADDNIVSIEYYNGENDPEIIYFYEYDNGINYAKNTPDWFYNPLNLSKNNVTNYRWDEFTLFINSQCNPCDTKITYNDRGYPSTIIDTFATLEIEYHE